MIMKVMNYTQFMTLPSIRPLQAKNRVRASVKSKAEGAAETRHRTTATGAPDIKKGLAVIKAFGVRGLKGAKIAASGKQTSGLLGVVQVDLAAMLKRTTQTSKPFGLHHHGRGLRLVPGNLNAVLRMLVEREVEARVGPALEARVAQEVVRVLGSLAPQQSAARTSARERGAVYARQQYDDPQNLSLSEAARHAHLSERVINERRNDGRYYALVLDGKSRGFRYPSWQFDADGVRLAPVLEILRAAKASCWAIHQFMLAPNVHLDGLAARDWILDPTRDVGRVSELVRARFLSDQGAG